MTTFNGFGRQALPFLKALDFHQNRDWFKENKGLYESELEIPRGDLVEALSAAFAKNNIALKGDRKGQYSIRINDQWRICFTWPAHAPGPSLVEIVDYH